MSNPYWQPYSDRAATIRRFIPDIQITLPVVKDLKIKASLKKHLYICRRSTLKREIAIAEKLAALAPPDGVIYDIGANIGLYSLVFAANRRRQVFAFEPFDQALQYLRKNVAFNGLTNVNVCPVLLSDHLGTCNFTSDTVTLYTSHISADGEAGNEMPCSDLDSYMRRFGLPFPDVIKMDVEGADVAILNGMMNLLRQKKVKVFLEGGLRDATERITAMELLEEMGYTCWDLTMTRRLRPDTSEYFFVASR